MADIQHETLAGGIHAHAIHRWPPWADQAARLAQGVTADDVHKVGFQVSDSTYWVLTDDSPVTWQRLSATSVVDGPATATDQAIPRYDGTTGKLLENSAASVDDNGRIRTEVNAIGFGTSNTGMLLVNATNADAGTPVQNTPAVTWFGTTWGGDAAVNQTWRAQGRGTEFYVTLNDTTRLRINTDGGLHVPYDGVGVDWTKRGLRLINVTAATSGNPQTSAPLEMAGTYWASGASRTGRWSMRASAYSDDLSALEISTEHFTSGGTRRALWLTCTESSADLELTLGSTSAGYRVGTVAAGPGHVSGHAAGAINAQQVMRVTGRQQVWVTAGTRDLVKGYDTGLLELFSLNGQPLYITSAAGITNYVAAGSAHAFGFTGTGVGLYVAEFFGGTALIQDGDSYSGEFLVGAVSLGTDTPGRDVVVSGGMPTAGNANGGALRLKPGPKVGSGADATGHLQDANDNDLCLFDGNGFRVTRAAVGTKNGASHTSVLTDSGYLWGISHGSACTYELQLNATIAHPVGTPIGLYQAGAGALTITAAVGVTMRLPPGKTAVLRGQYAVASVVKLAANEWLLFGDLAPA